MVDSTGGTGFDHIQIRLAPGFSFASPSTKAFAAFTPDFDFDFRGFSWNSSFLNNNRNFTVANGQSVESSTLAYTLMLDGNPAVDRPRFHYQTYLNGARVGNYDFYNVSNTGDFSVDWVVLSGTWAMNQALPPFIPGDANRDAAVDIYDIVDHWQLNYTGPGGTGKTWEQGDWNNDGSVDIYDVVDHWQLNYTGPVVGPPPLETRLGEAHLQFGFASAQVLPEPASLAFLAGAAGLTLRRTARTLTTRTRRRAR